MSSGHTLTGGVMSALFLHRLNGHPCDKAGLANQIVKGVLNDTYVIFHCLGCQCAIVEAVIVPKVSV